jgi:ABC-type Fe3+/spermidine/putrescine transport system ATPase subunit
VQWGTPDQIYYRPRTPFVADFVGSVNLFEGTKTDGSIRVGGEQLLSVRPESLRLVASGSSPGDGLVALPAEVVRRTFLGHLMRYTVTAEGREWLVDQPDPGAGAPLEGAVTLLVDPARVHVVEERDADPS